MAKVTLIRDCLATFARDENGNHIATRPFVGRDGYTLDYEDTSYDVERPTGYEPIYYLVDFGETKLWIPSSIYMGNDKDGKEIRERFLKFHN